MLPRAQCGTVLQLSHSAYLQLMTKHKVQASSQLHRLPVNWAFSARVFISSSQAALAYLQQRF